LGIPSFGGQEVVSFHYSKRDPCGDDVPKGVFLLFALLVSEVERLKSFGQCKKKPQVVDRALRMFLFKQPLTILEVVKWNGGWSQKKNPPTRFFKKTKNMNLEQNQKEKGNKYFFFVCVLFG